jgi:hypothetical protein
MVSAATLIWHPITKTDQPLLLAILTSINYILIR